MIDLPTKARELTDAIFRKQQMQHKNYPRIAIQNQTDLILILATQIDMMLDQQNLIEKLALLESPTIISPTTIKTNDDQNIS